MDFDKDNYSAGDEVTAKIKVRRPDGEKLLDGSRLEYECMIPISGGTFTKITGYEALNGQGEYTLNFQIPSTADMTVLSIALRSYMGYFADAPFVSSYSVPILKKDAIAVQFFPEFATDDNFSLVADVPNKIYFQVLSDEKDEDAKKEPIEFFNAKLLQVNGGDTNVVKKVIKHIHQGRGSFIMIPDASTKYFL